nr:helix-turn-helix domain-containing protein [Bradyrhizobium sp. CCBAU 53415]
MRRVHSSRAATARRRRDLYGAAPRQSVSGVAYAWGYINLGEFARAYRARFAERPSETLRRRRLARPSSASIKRADFRLGRVSDPASATSLARQLRLNEFDFPTSCTLAQPLEREFTRELEAVWARARFRASQGARLARYLAAPALAV